MLNWCLLLKRKNNERNKSNMNEMIKKLVCDKGGKMKMGAVCMRLIFKLFSGA